MATIMYFSLSSLLGRLWTILIHRFLGIPHHPWLQEAASLRTSRPTKTSSLRFPRTWNPVWRLCLHHRVSVTDSTVSIFSVSFIKTSASVRGKRSEVFDPLNTFRWVRRNPTAHLSRSRPLHICTQHIYNTCISVGRLKWSDPESKVRLCIVQWVSGKKLVLMVYVSSVS